MVEVRDRMVAEAGRGEAWCWEAQGGLWKKTDRLEDKTNPTTGMDSIIIKGRRSWAHVKLPGVAAPTGCNIREGYAAIKIGGEGDKK